MDKLKLFLIYTVSFLLQCTVLNTVAVFGITPNILLVLTIVYSFFFQKMDGIVFSILFGLIQDMFFGQVVGISPLIYFAVGMLLKMVRSVFFRVIKLLLDFSLPRLQLVLYCGLLGAEQYDAAGRI